VLRCVEAGQTINGLRYLPSAEIHSIAVTKVRLTPGASAIPEILFTHQNFERAQNTQQNARLVHVIDILRNNGRVVELLAYQCKPLQNFIVNIVIMSCPVQRFDSFRLEFGMTFVEALWPILPGGRTPLSMHHFFRWEAAGSGGKVAGSGGRQQVVVGGSR
jgi:hypothetical protein